jgi:hypothetical protein
MNVSGWVVITFAYHDPTTLRGRDRNWAAELAVAAGVDHGDLLRDIASSTISAAIAAKIRDTVRLGQTPCGPLRATRSTSWTCPERADGATR